MDADIPEGSYSIDTSVLIELLSGTTLGMVVLDSIWKLELYTTPINICEAEYVLCRIVGFEKSRGKIEALVKSNFVSIVPAEEVIHRAALIKCQRAVALPDCFTIALAEHLNVRAMFAYPEKELLREIERKPFDVEILFLAG